VSNWSLADPTRPAPEFLAAVKERLVARRSESGQPAVPKELTTQQQAQLGHALGVGYAPDELDSLLHKLGRSLDRISSQANPYDIRILEVIREAQSSGWLRELINTAQEGIPENSTLRQLEETLKSRSTIAPSDELPSVAQELRTSPYEQAAAVLAWFEPDKIQPLDADENQNVQDRLLARSVPVVDAQGIRRWTLTPERRITALRDLRLSGLIGLALAANAQPDDPIQRALEAYLVGKPKPVEHQTLQELAASHQVCVWLRAAGFDGLPTPGTISRRTDWLTLLRPFEHLAADDQFRGRVDELRQLRSYAGVLPPGSFAESTRRTLELIFKLSEKPPLLITGTGGVGKSTLAARFILEHARAHEADRFPFVYLDFDRADVDGSEPLTLLAEAARQLSIEYPEARDACEKLRGLWVESVTRSRKEIATQSASVRSAESAFSALAAAIRDFAALVTTLGASNQPILLVLDTFEEVQWKSEGYVASIWRLLETLQAALPRLRVVIAGRAAIEGRRTQTLALTGLDLDAAVAYLRARGITDEDTARQVARQIGGRPLSLKLAVELARLEGLDRHGRLAVSTRNFFFLRLDSAILQRQLYKRVLTHVHDEKVRKLAHPGLVLRRITSDLILKVLAEPCGIQISSLAEATALFEQLRREVQLVSLAGDGSLRHRQDLRMVTLELLRVEDAEKVQRIHELAVAYYAARSPEPAERAEEIYHRLQLDQELSLIDRRWIGGVERYLTDALEEFNGRRRAYLASHLKLNVDEETRQLADLQDWEKLTARLVRDLLAQDQPDKALDLMYARAERSKASPLIGLQARALARLKRWDESLAVLSAGFERAATDGERAEAVALALQAAEVVLAAGAVTKTAEAFDRLEGVAAAGLSVIQEIETAIRQLALLTLDPGLAEGDPDLRARFAKLFDSIADADLAERPGLGYWAATVFESADARRLVRVIRLCGLPHDSETELRLLAAELTSFDLACSQSMAEPPGVLARELRIPVKSTLTAAWSDFLLKADDDRLRDSIAQLLNDHAEFVPASLVGAFASLLLASLGIRRHAVPSSQPGVRERRSILRPEHRQQLARALLDAFSPEDLSEVVRARLGRNIEALSLGTSFTRTVFDLIQTAEIEGWLLDLVAQAHHARPRNPELAALAADLGLAVFAPQEASPEVGISAPRIELDAFRLRLDRIVTPICRVEIGERVMATGFLVGVDLLLTADIFSDLRSGAISSGAVSLRFDYREAYGGELVTRGTTFQLARDWLVASDALVSSSEGLGYALLRVAGAPGAQPVGGWQAESSERLRQWINSPSGTLLPERKDQLLILMHRSGGPLQLSLGAVTHLSLDGQRLFYNNKTGPGASGAPCLTRDLQLVGMHLAADRADLGFGVTMAAIAADLERKGLGRVLYTVFA
jgi:hypothetical protein